MNIYIILILININIISIYTKPISKNSVYSEMVELGKEKCPFLQNSALLKPVPQFLEKCTDLNEAKNITELNIYNMNDALCLLYYNNFANLCNMTNTSDANMQPLISNITLQNYTTKIEDVCIHIQDDIFNNTLPGMEVVFSNLQDHKKCIKMCTDLDDKVIQVCSLSAYMSMISHNYHKINKTGTFTNDSARITKPKTTINQEKRTQNVQVSTDLFNTSLPAGSKSANSPENTFIANKFNSEKKVESLGVENVPLSENTLQQHPSSTGVANSEQYLLHLSSTEGTHQKLSVEEVGPEVGPSGNEQNTGEGSVNQSQKLITYSILPPVPASSNDLAKEQPPDLAKNVVNSTEKKIQTAVNNANNIAEPLKLKDNQGQENVNNKDLNISPKVQDTEEKYSDGPNPDTAKASTVIGHQNEGVPHADNANNDIPFQESEEKPKEDLPDEDDEIEYENSPPQAVKIEIIEKTKPREIEEDVNNFSSGYPNQSEDDDSYFFSYFMMFCVVFIAGYVGYHNKQKILALVLEGRKGKRNQRRRPNSANYHKLDSNLEEAVSSSVNKSTNNVIY